MNSLSGLSTWKVVTLASLFEIGLGAAALFVGWLAHIDPLARFRWTWIAVRGGLLTPIIPLGLFTLLVLIKNAPTLAYLEDFKKLFNELFKDWNLLQLLLLSACAALGEEMFFRGIIQEGLMPLIGPWPALILTGVVFGMLHWINNYHFVWATFMGMFLGALYWQSANLLAPILAHGLYDFVIMVLLSHWVFREPPHPTSA